jgi:D-alanyl-D-alanine carboxypeptidase (penicillin-binding protein 5/6)
MGRQSRRISWVLVAVSFLVLLAGGSRGQAAVTPPEIKASAAVLMDALGGRVLWEKNAHSPLPPASTTKITTAILALEKGNLSDRVRVSSRAAQVPEASIWLEEGEELSLEELLYALLLQSANDAAVAIAEHIAQTEEKFVELMNQRARELGALNTHYMNPHGLDHPDHYTTAYDLAILTRHALSFPEFRRIVSTVRKTIPWAGHPWNRVLYNRNRLLAGVEAYPGALGVKTGYTRRAGSCLVAAAQRDGLELIAVVLNSPSIYQEVRALLDYGFACFRAKPVVSSDQWVAVVRVSRGTAAEVRVYPEKSVSVAVRPEEEERITTRMDLPEHLEAPVLENQVVGKLEVALGRDRIVSVNLVAGQSVARRSFWSYFLQALLSIFSLG